MAQIFPTDFEEKLTMAQDDYILFSDSEDGNKIKKAQYKNLKGEKGDTGARINSASFSGNDIVFGETDGNSVTLANAKTTLTGPKGEDGQDGAAATITVGTTTTGDAGTSASVTNSGTSSAAVLNFTIPKGDKGDTGSTGSAATISVGSTTTGDAGTSASVVNSGTSSAAVLDFTIPKGDKGDTGSTGATGNGIASITSSKVGKVTTVTITETNGNSDSFQISDGADGQGSGDVIGPASSTDGDVAIFDGVSGKLIKDGSVALSTLSAGASAGATAVQPGDIGTAAACDTGTSSGNVPILDSNGKLATTILPGVALTDTFTVSTSSDLTSLSSAEQGDLAIVTTENKTYVLSADPYSTAANWKEILAPTGGVTSVNSQTGAVTLDADDISDSTTTNKFVTATDKSTWSGKQDALTLPATPTQGNLVTWGADNETFVDGGTVPTGVPSGGNNGDVLTNVSGTPTWQAPTGGVQMSTITVTLTSAGWSSNSQTVSATGVTASNTVIVSPAPTNINDYASNSVYCESQGSGTLTFKCNTTPDGDISVNVLILS